MGIEILGLFHHKNSAEHRPAPPSAFELPFLRELVQAYDRNGYDRMLVANAATWPDSIPFAAYIAGITKHLGFMIAHRPGFVAPTMAARMLTTIDQLSDGRCAVHIITGGNDKELEADGDFSVKAERYARSGEYVDVLRKMWTSEKPFDHAGKFYRFNGAFSAVKPVQKPAIPVFWGGASPEAIAEAGRVADVYATGIDTLDRSANLIGQVRAAGAAHGRTLRYCLSTRLIVGDTEAQAWEQAEAILNGVMNNIDKLVASSINNNPTNRYRELISLESCLDTRLWTGITKVTNGTKAVTSLVGTAEQVVEELLKYHAIGFDHFLITGFDPTRDADALGRTVIPMLRERVAARERAGEAPVFRAAS